MTNVTNGSIKPTVAYSHLPGYKSILILILLILVCAACDSVPASTQAQPPTHIGLLEDPSEEMDIERAASPQTAASYKTIERNRVSLGFNRSPLWVRIDLDQTPATGPWVLDVAAPWMDRIDYYLPLPNGGWLENSTGLQQPSPTSRLGLFAFLAPDDTPRKGFAYLRLQSVLSLNAGLRIYSRSDFEDCVVHETYLFGALYGVMGAMLLFNTLVFLATRDKVYLRYILYMVSIIAHQFCLQGQVLFLPKELWHLIPAISLVSSSFLLFFGAEFSSAFLITKTNTPLIHKFLRATQAASVVLFVLALTNQIWYGTWLIHSLALVAPVIAIAAGTQAMSRGFRPARFYLIAWCVLLLGAMAWGAWSMGLNLLVPLPRSLMTIAAAIESILLSMALADRIREIQNERQILVQRERRYRHLSLTDELTGLFNSRYFWNKLDSETRHAHETGDPMGLILLDVDDFKRFNDTYGHTEGDKVLAVLGKQMQSAVRLDDSPCRYGGEEFALILPGVEGQAILEIGERIRQGFARHVFEPSPGMQVKVTVSLGAAQLRLNEDSKTVVKRADQALYQAKARGKNQTVEAAG